MRHLLIATVSALALVSTAAMAQEGSRTNTRETPRAYAPATHDAGKASQPFNAFTTQKDHQSLSEQDRLFLEQGDRGLGNG
ncbi:hypothetical protein K9U40_10815 [Xanthobacter autotrophicus]|uniref:hypothetical protein n=1 Tax=Xanthobacter TaxID=279 RepID=UPI0024AC087C|nr:hypothetical protein [Xanthobacter autotrophicus]MDI4664815.1 hypothetical protein [Xanthobacter autotrophicus]